MSKPTFIAIKLEGLTATSLRYTAKQDITMRSHDGSKVVHISKGEVYYMAASETLGQGWYYPVVYRNNRWQCQCTSVCTCKHERNVNAELRARFSITPTRQVNDSQPNQAVAIAEMSKVADRAGNAPLGHNRTFLLVR